MPYMVFGLFSSGFPILHPFLFFTIRATCLSHFIFLDFINLIMFNMEYQSWSSSLCNFLQPPATFINPIILEHLSIKIKDQRSPHIHHYNIFTTKTRSVERLEGPANSRCQKHSLWYLLRSSNRDLQRTSLNLPYYTIGLPHSTRKGRFRLSQTYVTLTCIPASPSTSTTDTLNQNNIPNMAVNL